MFVKDPSAILDYTIDWSEWLPTDDAISTATWTVDPPISAGNLNAPTNPTATGETVAGTLHAGTYYYVITTLSQFGESTASSQVSATTTGSTGSVTLTWTPVLAATGYNIYRGTSSGGETSLVVTASGGSTQVIADTGATSVTQSPPTIVTVASSPAASTTSTTATAFVTGGTVGYDYPITCHITTAQGRQDSRTITITILDQ